MRVLQVMAGAPHGGAELFFERLVIALAKTDLQQRAVIRAAPGRAARLRAGGIVTDEARFGGAFDFSTTPVLRRVIRDFDPDIALCWMSRAAQKFPRRQAGQPRPVLCARLGGYYPLKYYRHCDHLIGNTEDITAWLVAQGWPAARAHTLPNFVDAAPMPALARETFATPADAPLILAMGRLHPNKAFDVLLTALSVLPGAYLWLAGEGPQEAALRTQAHSLNIADRVRFLGWRNDAPALLAAADILVCPSRLEPLGNVVIEAWAHGVPVAASRAQGPLKLIQNGVSGLLCDIDDPHALAESVRQLIGDPALRARLSMAGREMVEKHFTEASVVAAYRDFFAKVTR